MTDQPSNTNHSDLQLERMLDMLRSVPPRKPEIVEQGRARYLAQLDGLTSDKTNFFDFFHLRRNESMSPNTQPRKFALTAFIAVILIFAFLFGGTGLTVYAAEASLPGDTLYSVKSAVERTRLNLTSNAYEHAQLHLGFAQKRLDEIAALIAEKRFTSISQTATQFEFHINQAVAAMQRVASTDPAKAGALAAEITSQVSTYAQALSGMLAGLPDDIRVEVERAQTASRIVGSMGITSNNQVEFSGLLQAKTADAWTVAGKVVAVTSQTEIKGTLNIGDMVKVHALFGTDGSLTAIEIEALGQVDDNSNANINDNANENEAVNGNANENENGNDNANENENENTNDNANENENENDNENENENGNDNANDNEQDGMVSFTGTVKAMGPQSWLVNNTTVIVNASTEFEGAFKVGDLVEIRAHLQADGSLVANKIERVGDDDNDNGNDNENQNDNANDNEDDHNENQNSNDDSSGKDNSNDDSSGKDNSNDDD